MNTGIPFNAKLAAAMARNGSWLCVGLDPDPAKLPECLGSGPQAILRFNLAMIDATRDLVCAYKPNLAFYEALGTAGWRILKATINAVPGYVPVILDAKRGDIGHTARFYARALFEELGADAVTLNPLMGTDSMVPFLEYPDHGLFVLCLTSNPGADDFIRPAGLHYRIAAALPAWQKQNANTGLVVGATRPEGLREIRELCPEAYFLVPGVGAQDGDLAKTVRAALSPAGPRAVINASRSILYASPGDGFATAAREEARRLRDAIREAALGPSDA